MKADQRKELLIRLGEYLLSGNGEWNDIKRKATEHNPWFIREFIDLSVENIARHFLSLEALSGLMDRYGIPEVNDQPKKVGIVMAGNIPLVGFHDLLCCFITGHYAFIKMSSKDNILPEHLVNRLIKWDPSAKPYFTVSEMLKGCDAYITTGSDNSARYFEYYFSKYPHIIRRNRTSVAILTGEETKEELEGLADDVHQYFGLGCRNVTKLYVPQGYDFVPLLTAFKNYQFIADHNKFRNNYDYNLAIAIMNNRYYMTNGIVLLIEDRQIFSPISQVNYEYYTDREKVMSEVKDNDKIQCVIGRDHTPFGEAQCPAIDTFADKADTMEFLKKL